MANALMRLAAKHKGCSEMGTNNYCQFINGDEGTNIIITVPHGGHLLPNSIPDRNQYGCVVEGERVFSHNCDKPSGAKCRATLVNDEYTRTMAVALVIKLSELTGKRPHLVVNHLHRRKLDANREVREATFGVQEAAMAYKEFHAFIARAKSTILGRGLLIDLHGQSHKEQWVELGYSVPRTHLNTGRLDPKRSSIRSLAQYAMEKYPDTSFADLIYGELSLGCLLQQRGYKTIPSPAHPCPGKGNYFHGGYNTQTHGSMFGGMIDAIQIEVPKIYRNSDSFKDFCQDLAMSIYIFIEKHYNVDEMEQEMVSN